LEEEKLRNGQKDEDSLEEEFEVSSLQQKLAWEADQKHLEQLRKVELKQKALVIKEKEIELKEREKALRD